MGAWGVGAFENDTALDWLYDFGENDFRLIDRTLAGIAAMIEADELDVDEAQEALAAAECIAAAGGFPMAELPEDLAVWVAENRPFSLKPDYVVMAKAAVLRVRTKSELRDLWEESDEGAAWQADVAGLQSRLAQI